MTYVFQWFVYVYRFEFIKLFYNKQFSEDTKNIYLKAEIDNKSLQAF